jgi:hypothetical protein
MLEHRLKEHESVDGQAFKENGKLIAEQFLNLSSQSAFTHAQGRTGRCRGASLVNHQASSFSLELKRKERRFLVIKHLT